MMNQRRQFIKTGMGLLATGMGLVLTPFLPSIRWAWGQTQRTIVPKGTDLKTLVNKHPENLDTRHLDVTPVEDFGIMGLSDYEQDVDRWRLSVQGGAKTAIQFSYKEIRAFPSIEKEVLLICPGFFANHGRWKGVSMPALLREAGVKKDITHVWFSGPEGRYEKVEQFPIKDVLSNKVFLAYSVNGKNLPVRNGFPLRIVAQDYYGYTWVKYVSEMKLIKAD